MSSKKEKAVEEEAPWRNFKSGFTSASSMAVLYAIIVFIPALLYLVLMTGPYTGIPVGWFTLILWVELAKYMGRRVTKQEAFMILTLTGAEMYIPLGAVYTAWYRTSTIAAFFDIGPYVPDWAAPAPETGVVELRTFMHPAWIVPLGLGIVNTFIFGMFAWGLGLLVREYYMEAERLPFPIQNISAAAINVLTGEEKRPLRILATVALFGFFYAFGVYTFPIIMQAYLPPGAFEWVVPIPWIDLMSVTEKAGLEGAMLGIATDLSPIASGFVLPPMVVLGMILGSFATYFFGNYLLVKNWAAWGLPDADPAIPGVQSWWAKGMGIPMTLQRSILYFWSTIFIGATLAVGLGPVLRNPRALGRAFSSLLKPIRRRHTDPFPGKLILLMIVLPIIYWVFIFAYLVPNFFFANLWIVPIMIGMPFISTIVLGRMVGETGTGSFPAGSLQGILYLSSGYEGVDVWFAPSIMGSNGAGYLQWLKVAELTETRADSVFKMYWVFLPIAIAVGYLYVQLFWWLAPIPSGRYPGVAVFWPVDATMQSLWIKGRQTALFPPERIAISFVVGLALYLVLSLARSPLSYVSIAAGIGWPTPFAITTAIGAAIAQILTRRMGKDWWDKNKNLLAAGLLIGEGIAVIIAVAVSLILKSISPLPY